MHDVQDKMDWEKLEKEIKKLENEKDDLKLEKNDLNKKIDKLENEMNNLKPEEKVQYSIGWLELSLYCTCNKMGAFTHL